MHNFRFPAEWEKQQSIWAAFPFDPNEWHKQLQTAQEEIAAFVAALSYHHQYVHLICRDNEIKSLATKMIEQFNHNKNNIAYPIMKYGDIWLRDTGPITMVNAAERCARLFQFNGWGGKYIMDGDQDIGSLIAKEQAIHPIISPYILEGGAIDVDGIGNLVTTEECLLNKNRNPNLSKEDIEGHLKNDLSIKNILWLDKGLVGDHTDGHVDNLARFIGPNHLLIPKAETSFDPNSDIFDDAAYRASHAGFKVSRIASVGLYNIDNKIAPASYMNFTITNNIIIIPQYGMQNDHKAIDTISHFFPERYVMGLPAVALLNGGGSFHCASQQLAAIVLE